jgi:hypothetical protein
MRYSLWSLMIVVTLICVVLGGRIEYLRRWAAFHEKEAAESRQRVGQAESWDEHFRHLGMAYHHERLERQYQAAMFRPWSTVDETIPPFQRNEVHNIDLPSAPNSAAPAPNPPKP